MHMESTNCANLTKPSPRTTSTIRPIKMVMHRETITKTPQLHSNLPNLKEPKHHTLKFSWTIKTNFVATKSCRLITSFKWASKKKHTRLSNIFCIFRLFHYNMKLAPIAKVLGQLLLELSHKTKRILNSNSNLSEQSTQTSKTSLAQNTEQYYPRT